MNEAKFKVGQVVAFKSLKGNPVFRILEVIENDGAFFYRWDRKNSAAETMVRELTPEEKGEQ